MKLLWQENTNFCRSTPSAELGSEGVTGFSRLLVVGCGLMGTSLSLAWQRALPGLWVDGVEINPTHRLTAQSSGAFRRVWETLPEERYDWAVLSTPVDEALHLLPEVSQLAEFILDICSVKTKICELAETLSLQHRFAPTHPMAGKASAGPQRATAELFADMPWLCISGWPACERIAPILSASDARVQYIPTAQDHDLAVAFASHGVHLASLSVMLAFQKACAHSSDCTSWQRMTGPGFRDVTRLSASPPGFWITTLNHNKSFVLQALDGVVEELQRFRETLAHRPNEIESLLQEAQNAYLEWKEGHA